MALAIITDDLKGTGLKSAFLLIVSAIHSCQRYAVVLGSLCLDNSQHIKPPLPQQNIASHHLPTVYSTTLLHKGAAVIMSVAASPLRVACGVLSTLSSSHVKDASYASQPTR